MAGADSNGGGNSRMIVPLDDGLAVESVYYGSGTLCLSTQAGCAVGCPFCASGRRGLLRNLTVVELQRQIDYAAARGLQPVRLTLSGIGEPLHNWQAVCSLLQSSSLPISLTTSGGPLERLEQALRWPHNGLMLSLHAGIPSLHRKLLPGAPSLEALTAVLDRTLSTLSRRSRRRFGINYLLLAGINDGLQDLDRLLRLLERWPEATLHLLTCNPVAGSPYASPEAEACGAVHAYLAARHRHVRRPNRWRRQAEGGCGTLVWHRLDAEGRPSSALCTVSGVQAECSG